jgi:hypothetical protein
LVSSSKGHVAISLHHYIGADILKLDSATYHNALGQPYTISKFRYYLSNFTLGKSDGSKYFLNESFLVDEDKPLSKTITLNNIPFGEYTDLRFIIGVDSIHNCSGAQTGYLDPIEGMFWAWNTGYIFMKLEGYSPASNSPGHFMEFHIGGYKQPNNSIRQVILPLTDPVLVTSQTTATISLKADISKVFYGANTIDFSMLSSVTDTHHATEIADNYSHVFSIISTKP